MPKLTIETLMRAPFVSGLVAAPTRNAVAWVQNECGVRNIYIAERGRNRWKPRRLTRYANDDGIDIGGLCFVGDGSRLAFTRGGPPNGGGEHPNPTSNAEKAVQEVMLAALDTGDVTPIAEGGAPVAASTGSLAWVHKGAIYLADGPEFKDARQLHIRGKCHSLVWSPDGSKLAFVSERDKHSFVGVYLCDGGRVVWLAPGVDGDRHPAWSPDSSHVAFVRVPTPREPIFWPREVRSWYAPWSIVIADAKTGSGRTVWQADEGQGSAFQALHCEAQLFWMSGDRIVFPWEKTGWLNLYAINAAGGAAATVASGSFEVDDVVPSADAATLVFSSNQDDIDRKHLWRWRGNSPPKAISTGTGIETNPVIAANGEVLCVRATARDPLHIALASKRVPEPVTAPTAGFPSQKLVRPQAVHFVAADGLRIPAQLFLPPDLKKGDRRPAAIFFHGGSKRQMLLGWHHMSYYFWCYAFNQYLASQGYVVLSVNYRSGTGYGLNFREALNYGSMGASEFNDVIGAGLYLQSRADVDPARIAAWGGSYGGYLTAHALARASDMFAAGVDIHGVHDWNKEIGVFAPDYDPLRYPDRQRAAQDSSPIKYVDGWRSPVLMVHGDDDRNVRFSETVELVAALRERRVPHELLVFPDEVHSFLRHASWLKIFEASAAFLQKHLTASGS